MMKRLVHVAGLVGVGLALVLGSLAAAEKSEPNPPAEGFDLAGSDPQAIALADRVMARMGGREAWDQTRYIRWSFFGRRHHVWDKYTGNIRIEGVERETEIPYLILMNIHTMEGRAWESGEEVTDPERLAELLDRGEAVWINDSYWLVMPYKLKDTGLTLEYLGEGSMEDGRSAEVLQLTFKVWGAHRRTSTTSMSPRRPVWWSSGPTTATSRTMSPASPVPGKTGNSMDGFCCRTIGEREGTPTWRSTTSCPRVFSPVPSRWTGRLFPS